MFSLKSLCLLKVSQLDWPKIGIIPNTLRVELEKMKVFNGNWFGYQRDEEINYEKTTVLSIQYLGEGSWGFQIRYAAAGENPEELFDFVLKEDEPTKIGWSICRGLSSLGHHISLTKIIDEEKHAVLTELRVDKEHPSKLVFKTMKRAATMKMVYNNKFQIDLDSNNSRVLTHGFFVGTKKGKPITGELPSGMVECSVSAKDALLGRLVKANRGEMDGNPEDIDSEEEDAEESAFEEDSEDPENADAEDDSEDPEDTDNEEDSEHPEDTNAEEDWDHPENAGPVENMEEPSFD